MRHFLDLDKIPPDNLRAIIDEAMRRKKKRAQLNQGACDADQPLKDHLLALVFEKISTRTRISFDIAMRQLGGEAIILDAHSAHLQRGETIADTTRLLSRYVDAIMLRTDNHHNLIDMAAHASVPIINGLTNQSHPCQILAAIMSFEEQRRAIAGCKVAWIGDSNNVACSWIHASAAFGFKLHLACPTQSDYCRAAIKAAKAQTADIETSQDPIAAASNADIITTDSWVSLSDDPRNAQAKEAQLAAYQITPDLMALGRADAVFTHCMPAFRGKEVAAEVADGAQSIMFDEAENRLHAQKAILLWVFQKSGL